MHTAPRITGPLVALLLLPVACGGASSSPGAPGADAATGDTQGADAASGGPVGDAGSPPGDSGGASAPDGAGPPLGARTAAVAQTIAKNALCTALPAFYWEIGDESGSLASGSVGSTFAASTQMSIASASKLVFGAYVVERFKADLTMLDASAMRMLSGYTSLTYDSCVGASTVSACLAAGNNATLTAADVGHFFYNGGHFQKYAVDLGLGADDNQALAADIKATIGNEFAFTYGSPQLAGGIRTSASDYAAFLRKILSGGLAMRDHLGEAPVCTEPSSCPSALYSPAPAAWHYSYAHWIEDDPRQRRRRLQQPGRVRLLSVDRRHEDLLRHSRALLARDAGVHRIGRVRGRDPQGLRDGRGPVASEAAQGTGSDWGRHSGPRSRTPSRSRHPRAARTSRASAPYSWKAIVQRL